MNILVKQCSRYMLNVNKRRHMAVFNPSVIFLMVLLILGVSISRLAEGQNSPPALFVVVIDPVGHINEGDQFQGSSSTLSKVWNEIGTPSRYTSVNGVFGASSIDMNYVALIDYAGALLEPYSSFEDRFRASIKIYVRGQPGTIFHVSVGGNALYKASNGSGVEPAEIAVQDIFWPLSGVRVAAGRGEANQIVDAGGSHESSSVSGPDTIMYQGQVYSSASGSAGFYHEFTNATGGKIITGYTAHAELNGRQTISVYLVHNGQLPPKAVIEGPSQLNVNQVGHFDGSKSNDNADHGTIIEYRWMFQKSDGTIETKVGPNLTALDYIWNKPGTYQVTLMVTDNDGQTV